MVANANANAGAGAGADADAGAAQSTSAQRTLLNGLLLGALGSVLFSAKAIVIKLAYRYGTDATTLIGLRMLFAAPLFAIVALLVERRSPMRWLRGDVVKVIGLGLVGYYASSYLDFLGLRDVSAGLERLILYLSPTIVLLLSRVLFGRHIGRMQWAALAVCYVGTLVVFAVDLRVQGPDVRRGSLFVLTSAVTYSVYLVSAGEMVKRLGSLRLTAWASLAASVACIAQALLLTGDSMWLQPAPVYALSVFNSVLCTFLPLFLMMMSIERLGAGLGAQIGMIGPASTIVLGAIFLGEPVTALQLTGTTIVLGGALLLTRVRRG